MLRVAPEPPENRIIPACLCPLAAAAGCSKGLAFHIALTRCPSAKSEMVMGEEATGSKGTKGKKSGAAQARRRANAADAHIHGLWLVSLVVLLIGLVLSGELVRLHFEATSNPAYHSYCSINETVSCDAVTRSKYSVVFGVPLAIWGVFGYTLMALTALHGLRRRSRAQTALFVTLTGFVLVVTVLLAAISHFRIHAWCLLCIGTYVVNVAAAIVSLRLLTKAGARASYAALFEQFAKDLGRTVAIAGLAGGAALVVILLFPPTHASAVLVAPQPKDSTAGSEVSGAAPESSVQPIPPLPPGAHVEQGVTSDGLPWIGAEKPVVTVTEFFDYACSHCQQAFRGLHELLALNPDRLRLVVRHFPLDQACNRSMRSQVYEHSCSYAKLANCAREQHRFWDAHEYLFDHSGGIVEPADFVSELKLNVKALRACLSRVDHALNRDIEAGIELELHGTPVFVVEGKPYMQHLPPQVVEQLRRPVDGR
jgi:uncharacterized membrane protein/protein-disulfide isomerase